MCFTIFFWNYHQSSSRLTRWKHSTVQTNMKKETNSMNMAPVSIIWACLRIIGIAKLPTVDAPVKNLAAPIHPPPSRLIRNCVDPPPKNKQGIGTSTYIKADNKGHQLLYSAQACHDDSINRWKINHIRFTTFLLNKISFQRSLFKILTVILRVLKESSWWRTVAVAAITNLLRAGQMTSKAQALTPCILWMMEALYWDPLKKIVFN